MKTTKSLINKLIRLSRGETLPASSCQGDIFDEMHAEGILIVLARGSHKVVRAASEKVLREHIASKLGISSLEDAIRLYDSSDNSRTLQVDVTGDSKFVKRRSFFGFLVNSYSSIHATLHGKEFVINPQLGSFVFVADYNDFIIPADVIVVGVENSENFRHIVQQRDFFRSQIGNCDILFVSRYPQGGDLVRWLKSIPNRYIHFGDLDLAGVAIFQNEFYKHLGLRASFLIPNDYQERLSSGSRERYDTQYVKYRNMKILDSRLEPLVQCIHQAHRGYDQEGFIK